MAAVSYSFLTDAQYISAYTIGGISSLLSIFGSCNIIYIVSRRPNIWKDKRQMYHRIMLCLSTTDAITTFTLMIAPIMNRRDTEILFARGNVATCAVGGFFFRFYLGNVFFNCMLSVYFVRIVRYGHSPATVFKCEYLAYTVGFLCPIVFGVAGLMTKAFNPYLVSGVCAFSSYPYTCLLNEETECERGAPRDVEVLSWLHTAVVVSLSIIGIVCTWLVYLTVRRQRLRNQRFNPRGSNLDEEQTMQIRAVARQAISYTIVFLVPLFPVAFTSVLDAIYVTPELEQASDLQDKGAVVAAYFVTFALFPLQGFLNWIIYIRPRLVRWKVANPEKFWAWVCLRVLSGESVPTAAGTSHFSNVGESAPTAASTSHFSNVGESALSPTITSHFSNG